MSGEVEEEKTYGSLTTNSYIVDSDPYKTNIFNTSWRFEYTCP